MLFHKALFFPARARQAAINRLKYEKLHKAVLARIATQEGGIVLTPWMFAIIKLVVEIGDHTERLTLWDVEHLWPRLVKDLGLVDDATGTGSWTVPGRGYYDQEEEVDA